MKTFKVSLNEVNTMHPVLAGFTIGLFVVALAALLLPSGVTRPDAWGVFVVSAIGGGIGRWIQARARETRTSR